MVENMNLPPTLLSRFDLIYLILDQPNPVADRRLAKHIVALYYEHPPQSKDTVLSIEEFAEYVSFARNECHPQLTDDAKAALIEGYVNMRRMSTSKNTISATPRQLESIVRLSEAHAKMRLSDRVEVIDVEEANRLLRVATQQVCCCLPCRVCVCVCVCVCVFACVCVHISTYTHISYVYHRRPQIRERGASTWISSTRGVLRRPESARSSSSPC